MTKTEINRRVKRLMAQINELEADNLPGAADIIAVKLVQVQVLLGEGERLGL